MRVAQLVPIKPQMTWRTAQGREKFCRPRAPGARRGVILLHLALVWAAIWLGSVSQAWAEQRLPVLKIGARSYTNVTVTTKTPVYIFILHSGGLESIKVKDLPPEVMQELGYGGGTNSAAQPGTNSGTPAWARQALATIETPQIQQVERKFEQRYSSHFLAFLRSKRFWTSYLGQLTLGLLVALHIFFGYVFQQMRLKSGLEPSPLVWVPGLQWIALFPAAGMSPFWFLALLLPGINIITYIIWSFRIVRFREKSLLWAFCLLLPGLNVLAFLHLAFSDYKPDAKPAVKSPGPAAPPVFAVRA